MRRNPQKKSRKRKSLAEAGGDGLTLEDRAADEAADVLDAQQTREFDVKTRLTAFRYMGKTFMPNVIRACYGADLLQTDNRYISAKVKFQANVRTYKHHMLKQLEVSSL